MTLTAQTKIKHDITYVSYDNWKTEAPSHLEALRRAEKAR